MHPSRSALDPARYLPLETLGEIFAWFNISTSRPPWVLGHICREWRGAASGLPALWTEINIDSRCKLSAELQTARLDALLQRSSHSLLSVHLFWSEAHPVTPDLLDELVRHSARWQRLTFLARLPGNIDTFFSHLLPAKGNLPQLRYLHFQCYKPALQPSAASIFLDAPKLVGVNYMVNGNVAQLPWAQMCGAYIEGHFSEQISNLQSAQNLVYLSLNPTTQDEVPLDARIVLPNLRVFNASTVYHAFHFLAAPMLDKLLIGAYEPGPVLSFLQRSRCNLSLLVLEVGSEEPTRMALPELIKLFRQVPDLRSLRIVSLVWDSSEDEGELFGEGPAPLFAALTTQGTEQDLLPRLSTLVYAVEHDPMGDSFASMLRSRQKLLSRVVVEETFKTELLDDAYGPAQIEWMNFATIEQRLVIAEFPSALGMW